MARQEVDTRIGRGEDFASLLEESLATTSWKTVLIGKEGENTGRRIEEMQAERRLVIAGGRSVQAVWGRGTRQMLAGLFNEAYTTLDAVLQSGFIVKPRTECRLIVQMVGACVGVVETEGDLSAKPYWLDRGYHLYGRLIRHEYYGKNPHIKSRGVIEYASLKYQNSLLVDDADEQRRLLLEGFSVVESAVDLLSSPDPFIRFPLHAAINFLASGLYRLSEMEDQEVWLRRWYEGARNAADFALQMGRPKSAAHHFFSAGFASAHIAERETEEGRRRRQYDDALTLANRGLELTELENEQYYASNARRIGFVASMNLQQTLLNTDIERQKQCMLNCYKLNMQAADLMRRNGDPDGAISYLTFCAYTATDPLIDHEHKKKSHDWGKQQLNLLTQAVEFAKGARDLPQAVHLLSVVLEMANGFVDQVREPHERRELLRTKLEGHMLSGKFEKEIATRQEQLERSQTLRRASVALGFAGNIARELVVLEGEDSWNEQGYNLYMESAELAYQAGDSQSAANMHSLASDIAGKIAREKRKTVDKIHWMKECYECRVKSSELFMESNDIGHAALVLGFVAMVAQELGRLDSNHQKDWDEKAFKVNVKAAELFISINDKSHATNSYRIAARIAERMELYLPGEVTKWKRNKRACLDKYLQLKDQRGE